MKLHLILWQNLTNNVPWASRLGSTVLYPASMVLTFMMSHVLFDLSLKTSRLSADLRFTRWWHQCLLHNQMLNALGPFPTCHCVSRRDWAMISPFGRILPLFLWWEYGRTSGFGFYLFKWRLPFLDMLRCSIYFFYKCTVIFDVIYPLLGKLPSFYLFLFEMFLIAFRDDTL